MNNQFKLKFEIGEIEFEAEGQYEDVQKERSIFTENILPLVAKLSLSQKSVTSDVIDDEKIIKKEEISEIISIEAKDEDFSRTSLINFIKKYGELSDADFVLFAAYYNENKNGEKSFNIGKIKDFYQEARRPEYSNNSVLINQLIKKGHLMEADTKKNYLITDDGIDYIKNYVPKEISKPKNKKVSATTKKVDRFNKVELGIEDEKRFVQEYDSYKGIKSVTDSIYVLSYLYKNIVGKESLTLDQVHSLLDLVRIDTPNSLKQMFINFVGTAKTFNKNADGSFSLRFQTEDIIQKLKNSSDK